MTADLAASVAASSSHSQKSQRRRPDVWILCHAARLAQRRSQMHQTEDLKRTTDVDHYRNWRVRELRGQLTEHFNTDRIGGFDVVDFGCGGGIDVILAAHQVGPQGKVVGIDFAPQMIERAKQTMAEAGMQDRDIELHVTDMEKSQLPDRCVDVVISNCVINLCPNKDAVYAEAFRILRPGGWIAISDIVFTENIDPDLQERLQATWTGCLGGAIAEEDYLNIVKQAGFAEIQIVARHTLAPEELEAMACCPSTEFSPALTKEDLAGIQGKVTSIKFTAVTPFLRYESLN